MSYFADLTDHTYTENKGVNVGWLDVEHVYPTGETSREFIYKLSELEVFNRHRGYHKCQFCPNSQGNGIVQVGKYIAPAMLFHYVLEHDYLPPQEFINALIGVRILKASIIIIDWKMGGLPIMTGHSGLPMTLHEGESITLKVGQHENF